jgi:hypothetical protein
MSGAIYPLAQYAFMAWCLIKAQGQLYLNPLLFRKHLKWAKNSICDHVVVSYVDVHPTFVFTYVILRVKSVTVVVPWRSPSVFKL